MKCDVLVAAAKENQITSRNADNVQATIVAEGANGPTTPEADEILNDKGVFIIPDILCNAGRGDCKLPGMGAGSQSFFWPVEEINLKLQNLMVKAFENVMEGSRMYNAPLAWLRRSRHSANRRSDHESRDLPVVGFAGRDVRSE